MASADARTEPALEAVIGHLRRHQEQHLDDLRAFVRIPSVSADPAYSKDVRRAAEWLLQRVRRAGLDDASLVETSGYPAVVATWRHAGPKAPTVLVYGHYDVQPAAKSDGWQHDPFEAAVDADRIYGRGTTDDKGQMLPHVLAAEAWLSTVKALPVNVAFVFEGEEEVGSTHFNEVLDKAGDRLRADLLIVSDSPMRGEDQPAITYSLRGLVYLFVDVIGPRGDLHSGTWGGVVWNPNEALAHMLATLKDPKTGKIQVPGFYDGVTVPSAEERARVAAVSDPDDTFLRGTGATALFGETGWTPTERVGLRPTLEVNGMWGGYTGEGSKTVIPRAAHAKLSCRLVAGQDPHAIFDKVRRHLLAVAPKGVQVTVTLHSIGHPVRADPDHPLVARVARALEAAWGTKTAIVAEGGTIPAVADMQKRLGVVPVLAGFGHKDENMHAPEESFRLKNFRRAQEAAARIYAEMAGAAISPTKAAR